MLAFKDLCRPWDPTIPASSRALEEAGVQEALTVVDPTSGSPSVVVERVGDQDYSQGRVAVLAMDAEDSDVPEGSQHDLLMEALARDLEGQGTSVDPIESDTESVMSERDGWSEIDEGTEPPADREVHEEVHVNPACRAGFTSLDTVDMCQVFRRRAL